MKRCVQACPLKHIGIALVVVSDCSQSWDDLTACCIVAAGSCRGKAGRVQGNMAGLLAVVKGTPTTYNKDLQASPGIAEMMDGTRCTSLRAVRAALSANPTGHPCMTSATC